MSVAPDRSVASAMLQSFDVDRPQTVGEEVANSISHGLALLLAIAAAPVLIVSAVRHSGTAAQPVSLVPACSPPPW